MSVASKSLRSALALRRVVASLACAASVGLAAGLPASALETGVVFVDEDGDGARDAAEPGRAGVLVSNGREVATTAADGRYALPDASPGAFVSLTCPADATCPIWFRPPGGAGEFGIVPVAAAPERGDFLFVHMSDAHTYPDVADLAALFPTDGWLSWVPRPLTGWALLYVLDRMYPESRDEIADRLRDVVSAHRGATDAWDGSVMMDYLDLALDPSTRIVVPDVEIPRAFAEVAALAPRFVVNTGDLVLEGNRGSPDAVDAWFRYYQSVVAASGLEIYETIGNNELAGTENDELSADDPRYGKVLFREHFGPTHYSFDRGPFHFVALDTHRPEIVDGEVDDWSFHDMEPDVRAWLEADLAAARAAGRTIVTLNHEPFHEDPAWEFDDFEQARDEGLFERYRVAYSLAGHIHRNGFTDAPPGGGVTHITTGALSGFRWSLPTTFDSRGYRLLYAHEGRLYSAWKDLGRPLLGFVSPRGEAAIHPASTHAPDPHALAGEVEVVAVAVDVDRPFVEASLFLGDEPLEVSRWGDYFLHAHFDADRLADGSSVLELRAVSGSGVAHRARLAVSRSAPR